MKYKHLTFLRPLWTPWGQVTNTQSYDYYELAEKLDLWLSKTLMDPSVLYGRDESTEKLIKEENILDERLRDFEIRYFFFHPLDVHLKTGEPFLSCINRILYNLVQEHTIQILVP